MQGERIKILLDWIEENPEDPFNWYSLALEYRKTDTTRAMAILEKLIEEHPAYVPTYYPLAQLWMDREGWEKALDIAQRGQKQAISQNKEKIAGELGNLGKQIQDEMWD